MYMESVDSLSVVVIRQGLPCDLLDFFQILLRHRFALPADRFQVLCCATSALFSEVKFCEYLSHSLDSC
jgi:hypothetical protein